MLTQMLWAKTSDDKLQYVSIPDHFLASAQAAKDIWGKWLSHGVKEAVCQELSIESGERAFVFLAAIHDIGKATPVFQYRHSPQIKEELREIVRGAGFPEPKLIQEQSKQLKHAIASQLILEKFGVSRTVAVVLGGHHGKPPNKGELGRAKSYYSSFGFEFSQWQKAHDELFKYALELSNQSEEVIKNIKFSIPQQMLMTGLVIMADWIASGGGDLYLPGRWQAEDDWQHYGGLSMFSNRFSFSPLAFQSDVITAALDNRADGIMIVEAPMGMGKTEAALAASEIIAWRTKRSGVYFALPSQATANGMFDRFCRWIKKTCGSEPHALYLAHSKANANKAYRRLKRLNIGGDANEADGIFVHEWFTGRKKGLLSDFAVGTIDQVLMGALKRKHVALRHLGLANKVVIIDEAHAYDAYMDSYLFRAISWLGKYGVPVIVLSATLPPSLRLKLVEAYTGEKYQTETHIGGPWDGKTVLSPPPDWASSIAYPLVTYTSENNVCQIRSKNEKKTDVIVKIERFNGNDDIATKLEKLLQGGGCAGIVVNTVGRAQELEQRLNGCIDGRCILLHSRFISCDRAEKEAELSEILGQGSKFDRLNERIVVIGTQVIEQSLDIDFDVLFTDICPIDLLLQRIGRLHRHKRARPLSLDTPICYVMNSENFDEGSVAVYGEYMLRLTRLLLPDTLHLPNDIPKLVSQAYSGEAGSEGDPETFEAAKLAHENHRAKQENRAMCFQLNPPHGHGDDLVGLLDADLDDTNDKLGEATVRDAEYAIEVIVIQKINGQLRFLPWVNSGAKIEHDYMPDENTAYRLAGCTVSLPGTFGRKWMVDRTIRELEEKNIKEIPRCWNESHWLRGELYLVLDENFIASLCGHKLSYENNRGLIIERES